MSDETDQNKNSGNSNESRMREAIERKDERIETLEGALKLSAFRDAGIDPEKGIGKAIYRTYDGEIDPKEVSEFAREEYDYDPSQATGEEDTGETQNVSDSQKRTKKVMGSGKHEDPPSNLDKANEAAAEGDWATSLAMKDKELMNVAEKQFSYGQ